MRRLGHQVRLGPLVDYLLNLACETSQLSTRRPSSSNLALVPPSPRLSDLPDETSLPELLATLGHLETAQLDFKREPARLGEIIPAMAMTDGGLVVLGIANDRSLHGCELTQKTQDAITQVSRAVGVDVQIKGLTVDERPVVVVAVPEVRRRIVTTTDGRLLRRVGGDNTPLVGDQLARFVRAREEVSAEEDSLPLVAPETFNLDLINQALMQVERPSVEESGILRSLVDLQVAIPQAPPADASVLAAAVLVFGYEPRTIIPGSSVQMIRRTGVGPGPGPTAERIELSGPIPILLDRCLEFIKRHTRRFQVVIGRQRHVMTEYPEEVLREAILNALAHRDYGLRGMTVDITVWDDRIEIRSPGGLPGPITLENIREEHYSRNRRIMGCLKALGLVEEYGEGIDRMFDEMEARLMDAPVITASPTSVTVILRNRFLVSIEDQAWLGMLGHMQLTVDERRVLALARREGAVTRRRVRQVLPSVDAEALLRGAVAKGLLVRTGQAGGARYELSDEVVMRAGTSGVEAQTRKRQALLDEVRLRGSLSTAEGAELLEEEPLLVRHLLNDLVAAGQLVARGQTRGRRYYLP